MMVKSGEERSSPLLFAIIQLRDQISEYGGLGTPS